MIYFTVLLFPFLVLIHYHLHKWNTNHAALFTICCTGVILFYLDTLSFFLLTGSFLLTYTIIKRIQHDENKSKPLATLGVLINLIPFIGFKIYSQLGSTLSDQIEFSQSNVWVDFGLPIGLAFYALQQVSAVLDVYKNKTKVDNIIHYAHYTFFLPNLTAGPFLLFRDGIKRIGKYHKFNLSLNSIALGFGLIIIGLAKKVLIADQLGYYVNHIYFTLETVQSLRIDEAWFGFWGFIVQLYFDFSAYSDIAIGMGLCLGIQLPVNFNSPLKASSIVDYIHRWHMSFVRYVREYVFMPISSYVSALPSKNRVKQHYYAWIIGIFGTYWVIGFWHSPNLQAVFYTSASLIILISVQLISTTGQFGQRFHLPKLLKQLSLLILICITAMLFRLGNIESGSVLMSSLVDVCSLSMSPRFESFIPHYFSNCIDFNGTFATLKLTEYFNGSVLSPTLMVLYLLFISILVFKAPNSMEMFNQLPSKNRAIDYLKWKPGVLQSLILALLVLLVLAIHTTEQTFIYQVF